MATADTSQQVLAEQKYSQIFELLVQQQDIRIADTFVQRDYRGAKGAQTVKQIGSIDPQMRISRFEPIVFSDIVHDARWIYPVPYHRELGFDTWDELMTGADPRSSYMKALMAGFNRKKDKISLTAFFADVKTGETGSDTTSFPAGQIVAVDFGSTGTNTHLTLKKIKEGKRILLANEVDLDMTQIYCSARATDLDSLMDEIQVVHQDYQAGASLRGQPVLKDGSVKSVFGVNLIHSEQHATSGSNTQLAMWTSDSMVWGNWQDTTSRVDQRIDLVMQPWQVAMNGMFGSTRQQEKKVLQILSITA